MLYVKSATGIMICQYRKSLNITQAEAAERCKMNLEVYQKIERGEEDFNIAHFEQIIRGLGIVYGDIRLDFQTVV